MERPHINHHISRQFNTELEEVRTRVLEMGGLVEKQLADALAALTEGDSARGELVVTSDYQINALEVAIDEECSRILARRQPAASDLRFLVSVIKTITDLERMGDEAERVGRMAVALSGREGATYNRQAEIRHLGNHVREMLHDALDAFARTDLELAAKVIGEDRRVDEEYESIIRQLITFMMEDPRSIPRALEVIWSARSLERIGDRACNICEYVIYFVKGRDVRHTSIEQIQREARGEE